jgi:hypothetical protein
LELICDGRSLLTGRPLAEIFDFNGLAESGRQTMQYRDGATVHGFVRFLTNLYDKNLKKSVGKANKS